MQVAVVGSGIIGLTTALRLQDEGHAVTLIAPASEPHHASPGNAGTIADYAVDPVGTPAVLREVPRLLLDRDSPLAIHRPSALSLLPWLMRFARQSLPAATRANQQALARLVVDAAPRWRALAAQVGGTQMIRERGAIYAYDSAPAFDAAQSVMARRRALGVQVEMIGAQALQALEPGLPQGRFAGGALFPGTLWLGDPPGMLALIAAQLTGDRIDARVTALTPQANGWSLTLATGERHNTEAVALAAGAWSARLLRPLGIAIPLTAERGYNLEFDGVEPVTRPLCPTGRGFYFTPMDGRLRVAGTVELGGIDAPPSPRRWHKLEEGARSVFPDLPPPSRRWMGLRPSIPDSRPVIGTLRPGLVCAFGHGHIGLTLAPVTAEKVARALAGEAPEPALSPSRF